MPLNGFLIDQYKPNVNLVNDATHNTLVSVLTLGFPVSSSSNLKFQTAFNQGEIESFKNALLFGIFSSLALVQKPTTFSTGQFTTISWNSLKVYCGNVESNSDIPYPNVSKRPEEPENIGLCTMDALF
jgi:hypothetical protein